MAEPEDIRHAADDILSRPEYRPPAPSLLDRAFRWMNEQFADVLGGLFGRGGSYVVGWIVLAVALATVSWLLWKVMPRRRLPDTPEPRTIETETRTRPGRGEWLARAAEAEASGNWGEAVRARYRAVVAGLIDREEIDDADGATSGEYRRSFDGTTDRKQLFDQVTDRFEEVWYGGRPAGDGDPKLLAELDEQVVGGDS